VPYFQAGDVPAEKTVTIYKKKILIHSLQNLKQDDSMVYTFFQALPALTEGFCKSVD